VNGDLRERFHQEYKLLHQRLDERLPELLAAEPDPMRRAQAYLLPQQFASFEDILGTFLADVFNPSKFESASMLRGVYFTSGTQEGTAFDRVMGAIKRYLQVNAPPAPPPGPGKSYFLKELLQQVIFRDAGVAGTNLRWYRRKPRHRHRGLQRDRRAAGAAAGRLREQLAQQQGVRGRGRRQRQVLSTRPRCAASCRRWSTPSGDIASSLLMLDRLRDLPKSNHFDIAEPPVSYRFGLYQGDKLQAATDGVYQRALESGAAAAGRAAHRAVAARGLQERRRIQLRGAEGLPDAVRRRALRRRLPAGLAADGRRPQDRRLAHSRAARQPRVAPEVAVRRGACWPRPSPRTSGWSRRRESAWPACRWRSARTRGCGAFFCRPARPTPSPSPKPAGAESALVIRRASGKPLTDGIPTLFTYRGYWDIFDKRVAETALSLEQEDRWVLQIRAPGMADITSRELLLREVRRLYLTDYIKVWDDYLVDIRLADSRSLLQSIQMTRVLSTSGVADVAHHPRRGARDRPAAQPRRGCAQPARPGAEPRGRARASASSSSSASPTAASGATRSSTGPNRWWTTISSRCAAW
jgi:type VI secretion system protein ImpL